MIKKILPFVLLALLVAGPSFADKSLPCAPISETVNPTEAQATDDYINLTDGTIGTTAAAEDEYVVGTDVIVWGLYADIDVAPGAGDIWDITVVDDGTATPLTCRISGTSTSCKSAFTARGSVLAGSDLTVLVDSGAGATDPSAAAEIRVGFCVGVKP